VKIRTRTHTSSAHNKNQPSGEPRTMLGDSVPTNGDCPATARRLP
jgi:hypothetical protein